MAGVTLSLSSYLSFPPSFFPSKWHLRGHLSLPFGCLSLIHPSIFLLFHPSLSASLIGLFFSTLPPFLFLRQYFSLPAIYFLLLSWQRLSWKKWFNPPSYYPSLIYLLLSLPSFSLHVVLLFVHPSPSATKCISSIIFLSCSPHLQLPFLAPFLIL